MRYYSLLVVISFLIFGEVNAQREAAVIAFWNVENLFDTIDDPLKQDNEFTPQGALAWTGERYRHKLTNLAEAAKMAGVQEQEVFGKIAEARSRLLNAQNQAPQGEGGDKSPEQKQAVIDAANSFGGTIGRLLVLQENYPVLKSNENFLKLQDEVVGTENRIATARKDYNDATQDYNTTRAQFPTVISAKLFGFKEEPYFKADEASKQVPQINANSLRQNQSK